MGEHFRRDGYIDFLRGCAVLLVVVGHCIQYGQGADFARGGAFFDDFAFRAIYSFHMPLFALVSGWLLGASAGRHGLGADVMSRRCRSLLMPIVSFGVLSYAALFLLGREELGIAELLTHLVYQLWFLWAMLLCSVVIAVIHMFLDDSLAAHAVVCALTLLAPARLNLSLYAFVYPFFAGGYLLESRWGKPLDGGLSNRYLLARCMAVASLWVLGMSFWSREAFIYTSGMSVLDGGAHQLAVDMYRCLMGALGCLMFVDITRLAYGAMLRFPRSRIFLIDIGRCSLGIYCFTSYLNPALGAFAASLGPNPLVVGAEVVAMVALGLAATRVVSRSGLLSYFLLGGRGTR